ncbi:Retrovirus-related Pol polyprotein from transposon TNT 1-94 [Eumeta japonica]|uniref:Retrovirus-related Pol polyprotein from transposon TNT 1-94 n=1 Tax=Eumeta variegata TaxID=151549 RepID=A0A4C1VH83_EUMVA|nr:Retrovirus-related Pol polyprotein from transposon TNT 1-94 [Eumeta japonica]
MGEASLGGSKYFVLMRGDLSNFRSFYFNKNKYEIKSCIEHFLNKAEDKADKVKMFKSDNCLEIANKDVKEIFSGCGATHQWTVPYTPEQNGKAERENRTSIEAARAMLYAKNLSNEL